MLNSKTNGSVSVSGGVQSEEKRSATYNDPVEQTWRDPKCGTSAARAICIISSSPLAAQYLVLLLQSCSELNPMLAEAFFPFSDRFPNPIFLLDCACLSLPPSECLRRLHKRFGDAKYIVIDGIQTENDAVSRVALGIHGMVEQRDVGSVLQSAVRAVAKDRLYISEGVLEAYVRLSATPKRSRSSIGISSTTPRETEILELVKRRLSNKEIALTLGVQESTVKFHLGNILGKLQLQSRYDLSQGTREGWEAMLA
jgi:DNA-binding NarL/FixJ family response regulator